MKRILTIFLFSGQGGLPSLSGPTTEKKLFLCVSSLRMENF